jgi:hypothetical protein
MNGRLVAGAIFVAVAMFAAVFGLPAPAYPHKPITTNILFKNEIAQIFQRKCFQCHTERNLGVSLTTYTDARPWARAIREEILERRMPPWTAVQGYGHFANDISLSAREMEIILSWTDGGAPSGVLKAEEPIPPVYVPSAPEWMDGTPDQILPITTGHIVPANAPYELKRFVIDAKLSTPKHVRAIALKQGDRRVVRHAAFYEEASGRWLGAWTPWQTVSSLPKAIAHRLPARARIAVEIGYAGTDEEVTDTSEIGLYFETTPKAAADGVALAAESTVAAGASGHRVKAETKLMSSASVIALWPNPTGAARSIEISAMTPEGVVMPLLWVKDYRPEWRSPYVLSTPADLPRGTRIMMTTYFDNPTDKAEAVRAHASLLVSGLKARPTTRAR